MRAVGGNGGTSVDTTTTIGELVSANLRWERHFNGTTGTHASNQQEEL